MRILGFVILVVALVVALMEPAFLDIPSALIVFVLTLAGMLASYGMEISVAFRAVLTDTDDREQIQLAIAMWRRTMSIAIISGGILGTFIGLVIMLKNMDDPSAIGPGMALGFLTTFYSLVLAFGVIQPLIAGLRQKLENVGP